MKRGRDGKYRVVAASSPAYATRDEAVAELRRMVGLDGTPGWEVAKEADCAWCNGGGWTERLPGGGKLECPLCHGTGVEMRR